MYVRATLTSNQGENKFDKTVINNKEIIKNIDWIDEFSNLKKTLFFYPTEEVSLKFNSFNESTTNDRVYSIFSLNFNINTYDFECIKILLEDDKIIYSFVKNNFNVRVDLIVDDLINKNAIKIRTENCIIK